MNDRTKKIMRLVCENLDKNSDIPERGLPSTSQGTSANKPRMADDAPTEEGAHTFMQSCYVIENSTATKLALRKIEPCKRYASPVRSEDKKLFSSGSSDLYEPSDKTSSEDSSKENIMALASLPSVSVSDEANGSENSQPEKGKKRIRNEQNWRQNVAKRLKNSGESYTSRTNKTIEARKMGAPCPDKCVLSCSKNFSNEKRVQQFNEYWALGSLQR